MVEVILTIGKHTLRHYKGKFTRKQWKLVKHCYRNAKYIYTCTDNVGNGTNLVGVETKDGLYYLVHKDEAFCRLTKLEMLLQITKNI